MAESTMTTPDKTVLVTHTCDSCGTRAVCLWSPGMKNRIQQGCLGWWFMMLDESPTVSRRLDFCDLVCALRYIREHPEAKVSTPEQLSGREQK